MSKLDVFGQDCHFHVAWYDEDGELFAEIAALRKLPVIVTCGNCAHSRHWADNGLPQPHCIRTKLPIVEDMAPPDVCPLRGNQ